MQPGQGVMATAANPLAKIELRFECQHLPNLDLTSKSDPQVVVFTRGAQLHWIEVGRSEIIKDNLNPVFVKPVPMDYYFERTQDLKFVIVDIDDFKSVDLSKQDLIGEVECTLGDIVGSRGRRLIRKIKHSSRHNNGLLIVSAHEVQTSKFEVTLKCSARHLDKKDFFGKSDPFVEISSLSPDGVWTVVHRTEVIKKTLDPSWKPFTLPVNKLSNGDDTRLIRFQIFDWNKSGTMDFIGEFSASIDDIRKKTTYDVVNPTMKAKSKKYQNSGVFSFDAVTFTPIHSFLDYIIGGCQINLVVAIDYTGSNGDPRYANSLHYQNPYAPNEYQQAIKAVGDILLAYDSDGKVPVFGFGAKMPSGQVSHCFHVNGNPNNPEVFGVQGILQAYAQSLASGLQLYGPTNFAEVIRASATLASSMYQSVQDVQSYVILLILTDGEISDMDATIAEIVKASYLPLSIIIVGVGSADFTKMNILDGDDEGTGRLRSGGKFADRDIVQFVAFRDYKSSGDLSKLAADVLAEVPDQFMQFMRQNKVTPRAPPDAASIAKMQQDMVAQVMRAPSVAVGGLAPSMSQAGLPPGQVPPQMLQSNQYPGSSGVQPTSSAPQMYGAPLNPYAVQYPAVTRANTSITPTQ